MRGIYLLGLLNTLKDIFMYQCEKDLEALKKDGWSYSYVGFRDMKRRRFFWSVNLNRNGVSYTVNCSTMSEAVEILYGFATTEVPGVSNVLQ